MPSGTVVTNAIFVLREWLAASNSKPGARLPSERLLIKQLGIKHNRINRAMSRLIAEGVVQREGYKLYYKGEKKLNSVAFTCDLVLARRSVHLKNYRKLARELGIELRTYHYESIGEAVRQLHALDSPRTESVLFDPPYGLSASIWAPVLGQLLAHGIPAISIRQFADNIPCVLPDQVRAVKLAFSHLRDLGHEQMAFFTIPPRSSVSMETYQAWQSQPWGKNARSSAKRVAFYDGVREDIQNLARKLAGEWKAVTALVVYTVNDSVVPHLLEELVRQKLNVPKDLSLICLSDLPHLTTSNLRVSTVSFDSALIHEVVFRLAQRLARKKQGIGLLPPFPYLSVQPYFLLRESTGPIGSSVQKKTTSGEDTSRSPLAGDPVETPESLRRRLRALLKRPYALTMTGKSSHFTSVDLAPFVNRPLNYRKGWMGDLPLAHFDAGKHVIHGVPFQVLGGTSRTDPGGIIFRSLTNETGNSVGLPSRLKIPIEAKAVAVYFLHGCGYTRLLSRFATYAFYAGSKRLGSVPLVALGQPPHDWDAAQLEKNAQKANIQDWWPDFPHVDFPGARQAPVVPVNEEDMTHRNAFLYTLEWQNPFPELKISHMEITVDSEQSTTLGVLAISVLAKSTD